MTMVRTYLPLVGFVVPTVIIGYGVVIPRSCIAGINELSVGFGTTVLGAVFTYVAGQRAAMPRSAHAKQPWTIRAMRSLDQRAFGGRITSLLGALVKQLKGSERCGVRKRFEPGDQARHDAEPTSSFGAQRLDGVKFSLVICTEARDRDGGLAPRASAVLSEDKSSRSQHVDSGDHAAPLKRSCAPIPELADVETALVRLGFAIVKARRCRKLTKFHALVARRSSLEGEV